MHSYLLSVIITKNINTNSWKHASSNLVVSTWFLKRNEFWRVIQLKLDHIQILQIRVYWGQTNENEYICKYLCHVALAELGERFGLQKSILHNYPLIPFKE